TFDALHRGKEVDNDLRYSATKSTTCCSSSGALLNGALSLISHGVSLFVALGLAVDVGDFCADSHSSAVAVDNTLVEAFGLEELLQLLHGELAHGAVNLEAVRGLVVAVPLQPLLDGGGELLVSESNTSQHLHIGIVRGCSVLIGGWHELVGPFLRRRF